MRHSLWGALLALAIVAPAVGQDTRGDDLQKSVKPDIGDTGKTLVGKDRQRFNRDLPAFTGEREAAALTFISVHHPEMAELLRQLKGTNPAEYRREVRVLFRSSETLAELKDSDAELYELELKAWVLDSRIRLLAARLSMTQSDAIERELRQALSDQIDIRVALHHVTRQRIEARLAELDTQIGRLEQSRDEQIERRMKLLLSGKPVRGKPAAKNREKQASSKD
jgi:hypothetical protein